MAPLTDTLKKDYQFEQTPILNRAFQKTKQVFDITGLLDIYDPDKVLSIKIDALDRVMGVVAHQNGRLIDYFSKKFILAEANYTTSDKEMLIIVMALKHQRQYTQGTKHQVQIFSDYKTLLPFLENKSLTSRQTRWHEELRYYDFLIYYIKESDNTRTDALIRRPDYEAQK